MENFLDELKKYFETTSQDKILEDWAKSAEFDKIGPTVEEFLQHSRQYVVESQAPIVDANTIMNNLSQKFNSGFFLPILKLFFLLA